MNLEKDTIIRIIGRCLEFGDSFSYPEILEMDKFSDIEKKVIEKYCINAEANEQRVHAATFPNKETLFILIKRDGPWNDEKTKYVLSIDSKFKYIEYIELRDARKAAREAKRLSWIAIIISGISIILSLFVAVFYTQTIRLEQKQFNDIQNNIETLFEIKE